MPIIYMFFITVWFLLPGQLKDYYPLGRRPCPKVLGILITRPFLPLLETKEPKFWFENTPTAGIEMS